MKLKIVESNSPPLRESARICWISEDRAKLVIECKDDSAVDHDFFLLIEPPNSNHLPEIASRKIFNRVVALTLTVELLTLSACETAIGDEASRRQDDQGKLPSVTVYLENS